MTTRFGNTFGLFIDYQEPILEDMSFRKKVEIKTTAKEMATRLRALGVRHIWAAMSISNILTGKRKQPAYFATPYDRKTLTDHEEELMEAVYFDRSFIDPADCFYVKLEPSLLYGTVNPALVYMLGSCADEKKPIDLVLSGANTTQCVKATLKSALASKHIGTCTVITDLLMDVKKDPKRKMPPSWHERQLKNDLSAQDLSRVRFVSSKQYLRELSVHSESKPQQSARAVTPTVPTHARQEISCAL